MVAWLPGSITVGNAEVCIGCFFSVAAENSAGTTAEKPRERRTITAFKATSTLRITDEHIKQSILGKQILLSLVETAL